jgi:hypothetical protein
MARRVEIIVGVSVLLLAGRALQAETRPVALTVRMYDQVGLDPAEKGIARQTAQDILKRAHVRIEWRACAVPPQQAEPVRATLDPCSDPLRTGEVMIRLVHGQSGSAESNTLGYTVVDTRVEAGVLATVVANRIRAFAVDAAADPAVVLGRAIAHELGHLLLGTSTHGPQGLMRATWTHAELRADQAPDWWFSPADASLIHEHLRRRLRNWTGVAMSAQSFTRPDGPPARPVGGL